MTSTPAQVKGAIRGVTRAQNGGRHSSVSLEWLGDPAVETRKEWVIPGMLGIGEVMVIHADTKVGKTQLATQISFAIATGGEIFGRKVSKGAVLYGAFEKSRVTKKRFRAQQKLSGGIQPPVAIFSGVVNLMGKEDADRIIAATAEMSSRLRVRLVVIDTLNRASGGVDENAAGPMGQVFNELTRIADEVGCAVIVLHHNAQGKTKMRGSSAVPASADVLMSLEAKGDVREAKITAANDVPEGQAFRFRLKQVQLLAAADGRDAEHTVVMEPIERKSESQRDDVTPAAVRKRATAVLELFSQEFTDVRIDRAALLSAARDQLLVSPGKSGSEQLRVALKELQRSRLIDFTNEHVWSLPVSNQAQHANPSLERRDFGPMELDQ